MIKSYQGIDIEVQSDLDVSKSTTAIWLALMTQHQIPGKGIPYVYNCMRKAVVTVR